MALPQWRETHHCWVCLQTINLFHLIFFYVRQLSHLTEKDKGDSSINLIIFCFYTECNGIIYRNGISWHCFVITNFILFLLGVSTMKIFLFCVQMWKCTMVYSGTLIRKSHRLRVWKTVQNRKERQRDGGKKRDSEIPEIPFTLYFIFGLGLGKKRSQDVKIAPLILSWGLDRILLWAA